MKVIVTMPAHNEEETIGSVIDSIREVLPDAILMVMCDRCTDRTAEIAKNKGVIVNIASLPGGLARVFEQELVKALEQRPDVIIHTDSDGQYEPWYMPMMIASIQQGFSMVMANRLWSKPKGMPVTKYVGNKLGSLAYSIALNRKIPDITTGFRAMTPYLAREFTNLKAEFTYTQETTWIAVKKGYAIKSIPTVFYARKSGKSRLMKGAIDYIRRSIVDFKRFAL